VVLDYQGARAELRDQQDRSGANGLSIRISGEPQTRLVMLALVRREIELTHKRSFPNLDYELPVPCICPRCRDAEQPNLYAVSELERYIANGKAMKYCSLGNEDVPIADLLGSLVAPDFREQGGGLSLDAGAPQPLRQSGHERPAGIQLTEDRLFDLFDKASRQVNLQLNQNQTVDVEQQVRQDTHIQLNLQIVQAGYRELGDSLDMLGEDAEDAGLKKKDAASLEKELARVKAAVAKLETCDSADAAKQQTGALKRLTGFINKLEDGNKLVGRTIEGLEDGREHAAKIVGLYNKLAPWCGLAPVPNLFDKK